MVRARRKSNFTLTKTPLGDRRGFSYPGQCIFRSMIHLIMAKKKETRICSVPRCERLHRANGFCASHDEQAKRGITPISEFKPFKWLDSVCGINGCALSVYAKGACRGHYTVCNSFSISLDRLQEIYDKPCGICGDAESVIHIDHDHKCCPVGGSCGACVRGGLCGSCNMALGSFRDDPVIIRRAIDYLEGLNR